MRSLKSTAVMAALSAVLIAAGLGLADSAQAGPVNGAAILDGAALTDSLDQVQHWRWGSRPGPRWGHGPARSHWRWGSRPRPWWGHSPRRSHWRWGSGWGRRF